VTLFTEPEGGAYKHEDRVPFGETILVPDPFFSSLHTHAFPR
jgi:hypothetical protein